MPIHISASVHIGDSTRVYTIIAIDGDQVWLRDADGNHFTREVGEVRPAHSRAWTVIREELRPGWIEARDAVPVQAMGFANGDAE